jgi:hypothetical protein
MRQLLVLLLSLNVLLFAPAQAAFAQTALPADLAPFATALRPRFAGDVLSHADAPRYSLELTVDPAARKVAGEQQTRYVNREDAPLEELLLRLYPNTSYMAGGMTLTQVLVNGTVVTPAVLMRHDTPDPSAMRITLPQPLQPKQALTMSVSYVVTAPLESKAGYTTFGMIGGILALPDAYAMIAPRVNGRWLADIAPTYGDVVQSEVALYDAVIHAPKDQVLVISGMCDAPAVNGLQQSVHCAGGPMRDFAIHLSRNFKPLMSVMPSQFGDNVVIKSYFTPAHGRAGENALLYAGEALRVFERRFGPYPFKELVVFESQSIAGGIEYPITVGVTASRYQNDGGYFEWIVAHEISHQWWYGMVGSDPINEAWLDEALAQYSASLYVEDRYGLPAANAERQRFFVERFEAEAKERGDSRADQPTGSFYRWTYAPIVYGKAPMFFDDVRREAGDARFNAWLRAYFERHRNGIATARDLMSLADEMGLGREARKAYEIRIRSR